MRCHCQMLGISRTTLGSVLNFDIHEFPHIIQTQQKLTANDQRRIPAMTERLWIKLGTTSTCALFWTSDEANYCLHGLTKSQNVYWGTTEVGKVPCTLQRSHHGVQCHPCALQDRSLSKKVARQAEKCKDLKVCHLEYLL